ncbi:hypothetical protein ACRRTK_006253 [Alexandromys fortis]
MLDLGQCLKIPRQGVLAVCSLWTEGKTKYHVKYFTVGIAVSADASSVGLMWRICLQPPDGAAECLLVSAVSQQMTF